MCHWSARVLRRTPLGDPSDGGTLHGGLFGVASYLLETDAPSCGLRPYVAGFFNGAEGDISADWRARGRDDAVRLGTTLASAVTALQGRKEEKRVIGPDSPVLQVVHKSVARDWPPEKSCPSETVGFASFPMFGVAALGGAVDGYTLLHQLGWHAGVRGEVTTCEHGRKASGLQTPAAELAESLYLPAGVQTALEKFTGFAGSPKSFPEQFPLTLVRIGNELTLAAVPVEMTTVMGLQLRDALRESKEDGQIVVVGLANEYFSYVATRAEYDLQFYEGAATILGPSEGEAIVKLMTALSKAPIPTVPQREVETRTFRAGKKTSRFGPALVEQRTLLLEDLEPFLPELGRHSGSSLPRFAWRESGCGDWKSSKRVVAIQRRTPDGGYEVIDSDAGYNLLSILTNPGEDRGQDKQCRKDESRAPKVRTWTAVWLKGQMEAPETYRFAVTLPGPERQRVCSENFTMSALADDASPILQAPC